MSERTSCNRCTLDRWIAAFGKDNVRETVLYEPTETMRGWIKIEVLRGDKWYELAYFMQLTETCVC